MFSIYCTARNDDIAYVIIEELQATGYPILDISLVVHDPNLAAHGQGDGHINPSARNPNCGWAGDVLCGSLGWIEDIDAVSLPGIGPLIVAGPLLSSLSLAAIDSGMGGFSGTLIHQGVPASKARNLECLVRGGGFMIAVHTSTMREAHHIANIFVKEGAEYVVTADPMKQRVKMKPPPLSAHHSH